MSTNSTIAIQYTGTRDTKKKQSDIKCGTKYGICVVHTRFKWIVCLCIVYK